MCVFHDLVMYCRVIPEIPEICFLVNVEKALTFHFSESHRDSKPLSGGTMGWLRLVGSIK